MPRRRSVNECARILRRRLESVTADDVSRVAMQLREYAIARKFLDYDGIGTIAEDANVGGKAWDERRIAAAIRNQTTTKKR